MATSLKKLRQVANSNTETIEPDQRRGEWRTHVYIPVSVDEDELKAGRARFPLHAEPVNELHVSLSKCVSLSKHQIEPFRNRVEANLRATRSFRMMLDLDSPLVLESESGVYFGCFPCATGRQQIDYLVDAVDDAMEAFGQEKYYAERIFHVSVASWKENNPDVSEHATSNEDSDEGANLYSIRVDRIMIRSGHELHEIRLKT